MSILTSLLLIFLSLIAARDFVLKNKPDLKDVFEKVNVAQGWVALVAFVWGLIDLIRGLRYIGYIFDMPFKYTLVYLIAIFGTLVLTLLGALLSIELVKTFVKNDGFNQKIDPIIAKIDQHRSNLGLAGVILGVVLLILNITVMP